MSGQGSTSGKQSIGQRDGQEDAFRIAYQSAEDPKSDVIMILADGMGGHVGGEYASNLVVDTFERHFISGSTAPRVGQRMQEALAAASSALATAIKQKPHLKGMGCTLVAAMKFADRIVWVSVGDSHLYLFRNNKLTKLNADHSLYGELLEMVEKGTLTKAEADAHPRRNALRSAVMGDAPKLIDKNSAPLERGDLIVLATDGLDTLSNDQIATILQRENKTDVRSISADLLNAVEAVAKPNQDNTTVIVYRHDVEGKSGVYKDSQWQFPPSLNRFVLGFGIGAVVCVAALIMWLVLAPNPPAPPSSTQEQNDEASQMTDNSKQPPPLQSTGISEGDPDRIEDGASEQEDTTETDEGQEATDTTGEGASDEETEKVSDAELTDKEQGI